MFAVATAIQLSNGAAPKLAKPNTMPGDGAPLVRQQRDVT